MANQVTANFQLMQILACYCLVTHQDSITCPQRRGNTDNAAESRATADTGQNSRWPPAAIVCADQVLVWLLDAKDQLRAHQYIATINIPKVSIKLMTTILLH